MPPKLGYVFQMLIRPLDMEHPGMGVAEEVRYEGQRTDLFPDRFNKLHQSHTTGSGRHGDSSDRASVGATQRSRVAYGSTESKNPGGR